MLLHLQSMEMVKFSPFLVVRRCVAFEFAFVEMEGNCQYFNECKNV